MKIPENLGINASFQHAAIKPNFDRFARKLQKIYCKTYQKNSYFTQFCELVCNILFMIVGSSVVKLQTVYVESYFQVTSHHSMKVLELAWKINAGFGDLSNSLP